MFIKRICYPVSTLGPGRRVGIWVAGCLKNCRGCMSPELRSRSGSRDIPAARVLEMIKTIGGPVDGFTISGGEPFLQAAELGVLVRLLRQNYTDDIIVYSGYTLPELRGMEAPGVSLALDNIAVLIDGPYVEELNDGRGIRGSSNQQIHVFREAADYSGLDSQPRAVQSFRYNNQILLVGIR